MDTLSKILNINKNRNLVKFNSIQNGRVNIDGQVLFNKSFSLYEESNTGNNIYKNEALKSIQINSDLSNLFFSKQNIEILQNSIKYNVWIKSNKQHIISNQSVIELKIIMRSIYLQYSKNINKNIVEQVKDLNDIVINYSVPNILSNIEQHLGYTKTVSYLPVPLSHPKNLSIKGTKLYQ
jgi:hypothetical protein